MIDFIGKPLCFAEEYLKNKGLEYKVVDNNFCVQNGKKLITNVKTENDIIVLSVGDFIFDLKERQNGQFN